MIDCETTKEQKGMKTEQEVSMVAGKYLKMSVLKPFGIWSQLK